MIYAQALCQVVTGPAHGNLDGGGEDIEPQIFDVVAKYAELVIGRRVDIWKNGY